MWEILTERSIRDENKGEYGQGYPLGPPTGINNGNDQDTTNNKVDT